MSETEAPSSLCFVDTNIWLYAFITGQDGLIIGDQLTVLNPFATPVNSAR